MSVSKEKMYVIQRDYPSQKELSVKIGVFFVLFDFVVMYFEVSTSTPIQNFTLIRIAFFKNIFIEGVFTPFLKCQFYIEKCFRHIVNS